MRSPGVGSEELLEKILRGVSAQKYADTVLDAAHAVGVSPTAISRQLVALTATKLKTFQERSLKDFTPFALFRDTSHRGGEAFLVAWGGRCFRREDGPRVLAGIFRESRDV